VTAPEWDPTAEAPPSLQTKEGWRAFCHEPRAGSPPHQLSARERKRLDRTEAAIYDTTRKRHHSSFGPIATTDLRGLLKDLLNLAETNRLSGNALAWPGAVIDAEGTLGKTTILIEFGRRYQLLLEQAVPPGRSDALDDFVPVAYVSVDSAATIKAVDRALANFYALPLPRYITRDQLDAAVQQAAIACRTSLFLIDDLHNLDPGRKDHRDVSGHFKHLSNTLAATFVFAGIGVEDSGLLDDNQAPGKLYLSQTRGRLAAYSLSRYRIGTDAQRRAWQSLIASFASHLVVPGAGELARRQWTYLHRRTDGSIGSLSSLLRRAANLAVDEDAKLTRKLMDRVRIDVAAERSASRGRD
jgi:hypothetical protein